MRKLEEQDLRFLEYFEPSWVKATPIVTFLLTGGFGFFLFFFVGGSSAPERWVFQFQVDPDELYSGRIFYLLFFLNLAVYLILFGLVQLFMGIFLTRVKRREKKTRQRILLHIRELEERVGTEPNQAEDST